MKLGDVPMKKKEVSASLFRVLSILPLILMFAALMVAYLSNMQFGNPVELSECGTINTDVSWKVLLKDNLYFPTKELGSDYSFIKELVDKLQFDLQFDLAGAPSDATVKINYQVDGVLQANYSAGGNGLLFKLEYPFLTKDEAELSAKTLSSSKEFYLDLPFYTRMIDGFQSEYSVGVKSKMDLKIKIDAVMETGGNSFAKSVPLDLSIPLDSSVFQISGSPSSKMVFTVPKESAVPTGWAHNATLYYLGAAVLMLLITIAVFLFFTPPIQEQETTLLKQAMHKCKGSLVAIKANPKDADLPMLPVENIDGLVSISESTGQPILYYNKKDDHLFLVSSDEILYVYELNAGAGTTGSGHAPSHGKAAL